ncbi:MAG TPA: TolC family protein [Opitutaceae bacterium]|nr:TolC family protein [Opitutaceae bacterium]
MPYRPLKYILLAIMGVLPAMLGAQTPPLPATLPEDFFPGLRSILLSALQQSPQMISHNLDLAAQEANRYEAASAQWPSMGAGTGFGVGQSTNTIRENSLERSKVLPSYSYNFSAGQPLYHWGALRAATDIAHLQIQISEHEYAQAYGQLAITLRSEYLSLIAQKLQLRNAHLSLDQTKAAVALVDDRFKSAEATADDVTNAHLGLDDANLSIDRATENFAHAKRVLLLTAGLSELADEAIPDEIPKPIYSADIAEALLQDFESVGLHDTFQAQIFDDQIKESDLNYKIAKYRLYPHVDLALGLGQADQSQVSGHTVSHNQVLNDSAGVGVSWSLFDGFATRGAKLGALTAKRQAERDRQTYLDQTREQARESERQLEFSARAMAIAERRFQFSEEALQRAKDNFKLHTLSQAGMDQATANFYQAQAAIFATRADFLSSWSGYLSLLNVDPVLNNLSTRFFSHAK